MDFNNEIIEEIINQNKIIDTGLQWIDLGSWWKIKVEIKNEEKYFLQLQITKNKNIKDYSFCIFFKGKRILGFCPYKNHINKKTKEITNGKHKHKWQEGYDDSFTYIPEDFDNLELKVAFLSFLKEYNIVCNVNLPDIPPEQLELN